MNRGKLVTAGGSATLRGMNRIALLVAGAACLGVAVTAVEPAETEPSLATGYIEGFDMPERDADGNLVRRLTGDKVRFREDGMMTILNLRAEFYHRNQVEMVFTTPTCTLDEPNRQATTDGPVRLEATNIVITGTGADWTAGESTFLIRSNVHVVISGTPDLLEIAGPPEKDNPVGETTDE